VAQSGNPGFNATKKVCSINSGCPVRAGHDKNKKTMDKKTSGLIMAIIGLIMLVANAIGYIFDVGVKNPALTVMGLVFVTIGSGLAKGKLPPSKNNP
jgi:hypothetical protein